jgi:nitrite reductase/ring-hydroxylating ferredoxin subunit
MTEFVVGTVEEHGEGEIRAYEVGGRMIAVASTEEGWFAVDDECTHRQCALSDGDAEGTTLTCGCHLGMYDLRTGEVLGGPPPRPIRSYPVRVADGRIHVTA